MKKKHHFAHKEELSPHLKREEHEKKCREKKKNTLTMK